MFMYIPVLYLLSGIPHQSIAEIAQKTPQRRLIQLNLLFLLYYLPFMGRVIEEKVFQ